MSLIRVQNIKIFHDLYISFYPYYVVPETNNTSNKFHFNKLILQICLTSNILQFRKIREMEKVEKAIHVSILRVNR